MPVLSRMTIRRRLPGLVLCLLLVSSSSVAADDWPMWRHDSRRTGATDEVLARELHLQWVHTWPRLEPAWKNPVNRKRMRFDRCYEPVVSGKTMFVGSSRTDRVTALETDTGRETWRFYTDGPVRFAPVAWKGKIYVASDDGHLYCLRAESGRLLWKFRGGPSDSKVLGNERLISTWPARGGPVLVDGTVYFAASIWPFMGTFIHALDAETGRGVWTNDGSGSTFLKQSYGPRAFAGVAPQGYLVAVGDRLLIPGGRSVPACYDRGTGRFLYYRMSDQTRWGGSFVSAIGGTFYNIGQMFDLGTGERMLQVGATRWGVPPGEPVLTEDVIYASNRVRAIVALDLKGIKAAETDRTTIDGTGTFTRKTWSIDTLWTGAERRLSTWIKAGPRIYSGALNTVSATDIPAPGAKPKVSWRTQIEGTPVSILAADGKLFVVTLEGRIYCFGPGEVTPKTHPYRVAAALPHDRWTEKAKSILRTTGVTEGYCLVFGVGTGRLVEALARQSRLHIVAVEPDREKVDAVRRRLDAAGLYGPRVAVIPAAPQTLPLPPYLASLIVVEDVRSAGFASDEAFIRKAFHSLRPYGGTVCMRQTSGRRAAVAAAAADAGLPGARTKTSEGLVLLVREGALPGSAEWTHQFANAANTLVSADKRVKLPLGLLWFGGSSNETVLPRHGMGPSPQVVHGRLFIEGPDALRATDVYTGRVLWEVSLPGLGKLYDTGSKQSGALATGANYVAADDAVYVAYGKSCLKLDPATGARLSELKLPPVAGGTETPSWGYLGIWQDVLVAGAEPMTFPDVKTQRSLGNDDDTASRRLVAMNRRTGDVLWTVESNGGFRHSAVALGAGRAFYRCVPSPHWKRGARHRPKRVSWPSTSTRAPCCGAPRTRSSAPRSPTPRSTTSSSKPATGPSAPMPPPAAR